MIEAAMFIALGFLLAALLGFAILPAIYRRAVRLTQEAMKAVNPSTYAEVRSAQDYERAQHALAVLRLERALEQERQHAVTHRLEAGKLTAELIKQKTAHEEELQNLRQTLEAAAKEKATGKRARLTAELESTKRKLHETEQALAAAQAEVDVLKAKSDNANGWLPTADTMALATVTGLESQIATLHARLAKYEAGEITPDNLHLETRGEELKNIVKGLEAQLVDAETQFISAQAEVARLTLQLEATERPHDDVVERLERDLKWAEGEKARLTALTRDRERALVQAHSQILRLRQDLSKAPELASLHEDLVALAEKLAGGGKAATAPNQAVTESLNPASTDKRQSQTPISALVNKIVKSSQANADPSSQSKEAASAPKKAGRTSKDKKRDVA